MTYQRLQIGVKIITAKLMTIQSLGEFYIIIAFGFDINNNTNALMCMNKLIKDVRIVWTKSPPRLLLIERP